MDICFATNNPNKVKEVADLLGNQFYLKSLKEIGCHEDLKEEQEDLAGNAKQKAEYVFSNYKINCFADDTGLEVESLNGEPGVYSARYAGNQRSDEDNIQLLLDNLKGASNRSAQFRTVICLYLDGEKHLFEGIVKGQITESHTGNSGFGYDPIFKPDGFDKTFAEMNLQEKNKISHRGKAVAQLVNFLKTNA